MRLNLRTTFGAVFASLTATSLALACGTPPPMNPPPPPPDPPIVCCQVIDRVPCPDDPCNFEYWLVCYGRIDGIPLFQSNAMPLLPNQKCLCAIPPLPQIAIDGGASVVGLWFTNPQNIPWDPTLIPDEPGYGPFEPLPNSEKEQFQVDSFFDIYYQAAGVVNPPIGPFGNRASVFSFQGPGQIPDGVVFNIYQCLRVPRGFPADLLCPPLQEGVLGLFLGQDGAVGLEPSAPGLPPIPLAGWAPGDGAMYKFRWYPIAVPPSCPPVHPGDLNGDLAVNSSDLGILIGNFGTFHPCP